MAFLHMLGYFYYFFFSALSNAATSLLSTLCYRFQSPLFLLVFLDRADSSRKEFLATSCDRQPVVFSEEDPASPSPDEGR